MPPCQYKGKALGSVEALKKSRILLYPVLMIHMLTLRLPRLSLNKPLKTAVRLGASDTIKILLTTQEDKKSKRPHQAFLQVKDPQTNLETSFAFSVKESGKGKVELVRNVRYDNQLGTNIRRADSKGHSYSAPHLSQPSNRVSHNCIFRFLETLQFPSFRTLVSIGSQQSSHCSRTCFTLWKTTRDTPYLQIRSEKPTESHFVSLRACRTCSFSSTARNRTCASLSCFYSH